MIIGFLTRKESAWSILLFFMAVWDVGIGLVNGAGWDVFLADGGGAFQRCVCFSERGAVTFLLELESE
jgi:hypothetical protein